MMDYEQAKAMALEAGFSNVARLDASTIELKDEVRAMCASQSCGAYGHNWSCPPACGELSELREKVGKYHEGILVQTVGELEDQFDGEGMMEAQYAHKEHFQTLHDKLVELYPNMLSLSAGTCTRCKKCSYPDAPCRFPDKRFSSMEAYGMLVMEVCKANDLQYYYGSNAIAYTSCFLLD